MRFQKILVAIDNSQLTHSVFAAALELARSNKAAIKLLHCIVPEMLAEPVVPTTLDMSIQPGLLSNDYQTQQILIEQQIEAAQTILKAYSEQAQSDGVPTEFDYPVGETGHQLCEVAKDWGADLIVVGRRGRSGLAEAFLGSVSNYVVHHAPCSVLVIQEVELEPAAEAIANVSSVEINPALIEELS
jgi:nucleotide-binding universal stress UspA family protein